MKNKNRVLSICISIVMLFSTITIVQTVQAGQFHIIKGTLYADDAVIGEGAQIKVNILTDTFYFDTFDPDINGYTFYLGGFDNDQYYNATAYLTVLYNSIWYTPIDNASIVLNKNTNPAVENYIVDLHINTSDTEPPTKVTGLTVTDAKDGKLDLEWNPATDNVAVAFYNIYWGEDDYETPIATVNHPTTSYQHTDLINEQEYCYKVSAVDTSNNEGEKSNTACGTPNESQQTIPIIQFLKDNINKRLTVITVEPENLEWSNFTITGICNTSTLGTYVLAGDTITECSGTITITYNPTSTLMGIWTFTEEDDIPPTISFETPANGSLYLFGRKILSGRLKTPLVIRKLNIVINATDNETGISHVELSIKGRVREITKNLTESPYTYVWRSFGFGLYNITATAYDFAGNSANTSIVVRKLF